METESYIFKILVLGMINSGKTSVCRRFIEDKFSPKYVATLGMDLLSKTIEIDENQIKLSIWDTAGSYNYEKILHLYFKGTLGAIIVYDVNEESSFEVVDHWIAEIEKYCSHVPIVVLGNKADLVENPDDSVLSAIRDKWGDHWRKDLTLIYSSAKTGKNIEYAFSRLCREILKEIKESEEFENGEFI